MTDTAPFRIKDFSSIVEDMILTARAHTDRITDYNIGSVARTVLEAAGLELDALYQAMYFNLLDAIPIAIYEGFAFPSLPARSVAWALASSNCWRQSSPAALSALAPP